MYGRRCGSWAHPFAISGVRLRGTAWDSAGQRSRLKWDRVRGVYAVQSEAYVGRCEGRWSVVMHQLACRRVAGLAFDVAALNLFGEVAVYTVCFGSSLLRAARRGRNLRDLVI